MTAAAVTGPKASRFSPGASLRRNRRWALITSYVFLIIFAIFFLIPPYYMIVTALKTDAEVAHPAGEVGVAEDVPGVGVPRNPHHRGFNASKSGWNCRRYPVSSRSRIPQRR